MRKLFDQLNIWQLSKKTKSAYEVMWIYYNMSIVNFLHVSTTFCGHLQGNIIWRWPQKWLKHVGGLW